MKARTPRIVVKAAKMQNLSAMASRATNILNCKKFIEWIKIKDFLWRLICNWAIRQSSHQCSQIVCSSKWQASGQRSVWNMWIHCWLHINPHWAWMFVGLNQYGMRQEPRQMPLGPTQTISNNQPNAGALCPMHCPFQLAFSMFKTQHSMTDEGYVIRGAKWQNNKSSNALVKKGMSHILPCLLMQREQLVSENFWSSIQTGFKQWQEKIRQVYLGSWGDSWRWHWAVRLLTTSLFSAMSIFGPWWLLRALTSFQCVMHY